MHVYKLDCAFDADMHHILINCVEDIDHITCMLAAHIAVLPVTVM